MDVILPVLNQVQPDGTLYLKEYLLKAGHARGLSMACQLNGQLFSKVFIDNCGLTEVDTANLATGFASLDKLSSIVLRRTVVGLETIAKLALTFIKIIPDNLSTLKIERCQISKEATYDLVSILSNKNYLRCLSLVSVNFDAESIGVMCELLEKKNYLEELDLSDNRLDPKLFLPLLKSLGESRLLRHVNIAWNLLLNKSKPP